MSFRFITYALFMLCLHFEAIGQPFNWTTTTNLPEKRSFHLAFGWNGHIYIVGGVNSSQNVDGHVNYAAILPDNSLGAWTLGPSVTSDLYQPGGGIFADSGWIYVAGGVSTGSPLSEVFYAKLDPDGSIGSWQSTSSLPEGTSSPASTLHQKYLYVIGGGHHFADYDGSNTVYFAQVQSDGSLSAWNSTTPYPGQLLSSFCLGTGTRLYVLGGLRHAYGWITDSVYYADINPDGTLGSWTLAGKLPRAMFGMNGYVDNGKIFIAGGQDSSGTRDSIYSSAINPDGSLTSWMFEGVLPVKTVQFGLVKTSSALYLLGGENASGYLDSAYFTSANVPREVVIDIKPGSDPNSVNCDNQNALVPVAILTTAEFDATTVDHSTVVFGPDSARELHCRQSGKKGGSSQINTGKGACIPVRHQEDVDGDGDLDLVLHFLLRSTGIGCEETSGILRGMTYAGEEIVGTDAIRFVKHSGENLVNRGQTSTPPTDYSLSQNYPNPFNPTTTIEYSIPVGRYVILSVFNMIGQKVATLVDGYEEPGSKTVDFDATELPSGVYTYRLVAGSYSIIKTMLLVR